MVKNVISRANKKITIGGAAALLSATYFVSSILGLFIRRLLAAEFGVNTGMLDPYWAAFSLPDLTLNILVAGAISVVLVPLVTEKLERYEKKEAWELTTNVINFLAAMTLALGLFLFIFADPLMWLVAPGFDQAKHDVAVNLMRIFTVSPVLFSISSVLGGVQQAFGRFFFFALAPVVYNLSIIFGILVLAPRYSLYGVAMGVVVGALMQLFAQSLGLFGLNYRHRFQLNFNSYDFKKFLRLLGPRSVDQGAEQLNLVIERAIATTLVVGVGTAVLGDQVTGITYYQYAHDLKNVPITLIGVAIATAAFPEISRRAASVRTDLFKKEVREILQVLLWFSVPAAATTLLMRGYLVRLLVGESNDIIASILGWFTLAIVFQAMLHIIARAFYARQNTKVPLYSGLIAIVVNVILAIILTRKFGVPGLAMAQSLVAVLEVVVLTSVLRWEIGKLLSLQFIVSVSKTITATLIMSGVMYLLVRYGFPLRTSDVGFFTLVPRFLAIALLSGATYLMASSQLRMPEAMHFTNWGKKLIFRRIIIKTD